MTERYSEDREEALDENERDESENDKDERNNKDRSGAKNKHDDNSMLQVYWIRYGITIPSPHYCKDKIYPKTFCDRMDEGSFYIYSSKIKEKKKQLHISIISSFECIEKVIQIGKSLSVIDFYKVCHPHKEHAAFNGSCLSSQEAFADCISKHSTIKFEPTLEQKNAFGFFTDVFRTFMTQKIDIPKSLGLINKYSFDKDTFIHEGRFSLQDHFYDIHSQDTYHSGEKYTYENKSKTNIIYKGKSEGTININDYEEMSHHFSDMTYNFGKKTNIFINDKNNNVDETNDFSLLIIAFEVVTFSLLSSYL